MTSRFPQRTLTALGAVLSVALQASWGIAQAPQKPGKVRVADAIREARKASSATEKERAYKAISEESVEGDDDVRALADELRRLPDEASTKDTKKYVEASRHLADVLSKCRTSRHHAVVRNLLEQEVREIPQGFSGPWSANSQAEALREGIRFGRYEALIRAAGEGRNEQALDALRKIRRKGGEVGKAAEKAIGQIGKDEDLEDFVREVRSDPDSRTNLNVFGKKAADRILRELEDEKVPDDEKVRFASALPKNLGAAELDRLRPMLKHKNRRVASLVAAAIAAGTPSNDMGTVRDLLKHPDMSVQAEALAAIAKNWRPDYLPDLLKILKEDRYGFRRSQAASILGQNRVVEARTALEDAVKNDPDENVRDSARFALERMR